MYYTLTKNNVGIDLTAYLIYSRVNVVNKLIIVYIYMMLAGVSSCHWYLPLLLLYCQSQCYLLPPFPDSGMYVRL